MISQRQEIRKIRAHLKSTEVSLVASETNLFEAFAISDESTRQREIRTLVSVATRFEARPQSWHQAEEVRRALARYRRDWLRPLAFQRSARQFLGMHSARWQDATEGRLPGADQFANYRTDFESGVKTIMNYQKVLRKERLAGEQKRLLASQGVQGFDPVSVDMTDPEVFWRVESLLVWNEAITVRNPSCRDYFDWLAPHLRPKVFEGASYQDFWLTDVLPEDVPKNRLSSLLSFYQLGAKVTHGNAADSLHGCHALDVHAFLTADVPFFQALTSASKHFPSFARIVFVERSAESLMPFLVEALSGLKVAAAGGGG